MEDGKQRCCIYYPLTTSLTTLLKKKLRNYVKKISRIKCPNTPQINSMTLQYIKKNTNTKDINNDITAKWIILNSLGEKTQSIIQGDGKTLMKSGTS